MRQRRAASVALSLLLPVVAGRAGAQVAAGVGEDAYVLPSRALRVSFAPSFEYADQRFRSDGTREPLGAGLSGAWDATRLGVLVPGEAALRSLSGLADATLSLGDVRVTADRRSTVIPLAIEYGLFGRVQLGVNVPFVRTIANVVADANDARSAGSGLNAALFGDDEAAVQNSQLVSQLITEAGRREEQAGLPAGGCATSALPACAVVNDARAAANDLEALYLRSPVVPREGTAAAEAIDARIATLDAALGDALTITSPAHAALPIGRTDLSTLYTDPVNGFGFDDFRVVERSHFGDIEGSIKVKLLDGIGPLGAAPARPVGIRVAVGALVRAPTGQGEQPGNPLDVGTGDGQTDVELRGAMDVTLGRHLWISGAVRAVTQLEDEQFVRAPYLVGEPLLAGASRLTRARRDLGDAVQVEATPRWMPNDYFTVSATWQLRRKDADSYSAVAGDAAYVEQVYERLGAGTELTEQRVGFGITWSTLSATRRGKRAIPLDVSYLHLQTVRATDGITPRLVTDQLRLRLWWGAARDARRARSPGR